MARDHHIRIQRVHLPQRKLYRSSLGTITNLHVYYVLFYTDFSARFWVNLVPQARFPKWLGKTIYLCDVYIIMCIYVLIPPSGTPHAMEVPPYSARTYQELRDRIFRVLFSNRLRL